jgi:hypothetical protein
MHTLATTRPVDAPRISGFGSRLLFFWLVARDRDTHEVARKTVNRLADTGPTRSRSEASVVRNGGKIDLPLRALSGW